MKRVGNVASNRIYNPENTRPPIPFDVDEADSAMERFIRQKYQERAINAQARQNTGSTNSDDQPPPLPPKTGSRFGFRSASSIFPLSSKARREAARPVSRERSPSPPRRNKPSRVFGTAVGSDDSDELDSKLAKLRDMGFRDERRNLTVLKGLSGNLEKSVETLVRLGEGGGNSMRSGENNGPSSRSRTPISPTAGITINRSREKISPKVSSNPFDMLDDLPPPPPPPQSTQSTGSLAQPQMGNNPFNQVQNGNPYGIMPSQSQYNLNQAFQSMNVSPSQPLFPHHTGGFSGPQQQQFQQIHQQSMTPPVPSVPQQYYSSVIYENVAQQPQQTQQQQVQQQQVQQQQVQQQQVQQQQLQQPQQSYNPFMQQMQQQQPPQQQARQAPPINTNFPSNPYAQQQPTPQATPVTSHFQSNPYSQNQGTPQAYVQSPMEQSQPQTGYFNNGIQQQQQPNPFLQNSNQHQMPQPSYTYQPQQLQQQLQGQAQYQQFRGQTHPILPQQTLRADKRSILDLYNYPQMAPIPQQPLQPQQQPQQQEPSQMQSPPRQVLDTQQQQRSVSSPASAPAGGNRNPFALNGGGGGGGADGIQSAGADSLGSMPRFPSSSNSRHVSQESVDAGGWQSGRHSPDAWGTISARSVR